MKLRIDGETIDSGKSYSGGRVIELLKISYNHGYQKGFMEGRDKAIEENQEDYDELPNPD